MKICIFERSNEKNHFSKTKIYFHKKTTPQLSRHIIIIIININIIMTTKYKSRGESKFWVTCNCFWCTLTLALKTFQWHGWTQSSNNSIFLFEIYQIFRWKIFYLHLQSSSASRKWKNSNVVRFADFVYKVRRDPRETLRKFSPDTVFE